MMAMALLTPLLVLGILPLLHDLEAWMRRDTPPGRDRPPRPQKGPPMIEQTPPTDGADLVRPVPRDPPPPPGYVDPLAGSTAENTVSSVPAIDHEVAGHDVR